MAKTPVKFKRVAEVFFGGGGESSLSEWQLPAESLTDLSDLVNSFLESDEIQEIDSFEAERIDGTDSENFCGNSEIKDLLRGFLENEENGDVKEKIRVEVELACGTVIGYKSSSPEFKRRLMTSLRERGFDAGKSLSPCVYIVIIISFLYRLKYMYKSPNK